MVALLNPGDSLSLADAALAAARYGFNDRGQIAWTPPMPHPQDGAWSTQEQGARGNAAAFALTTSGAGAGSTPLSVSGTVEGIGELSTGTTTTGRATSSFQAAATSIVLDTTSGQVIFDAIVAIPTLPDGTETFGVAAGLLDIANNVDQTDGCYFRLTTASANFQCITSSNSTRTTTDSGFAPSAGQFYRLKIVCVNVTEVRFYISTQSTNTTAVMSLVATNTTNIPTGTTRATGAGVSIVKTAGTTARTLQYQYQRVQRRPIRTPVGVRFGSGFGQLNPGDSFNGQSGGVGMQAANQRLIDGVEDNLTETPIWNERIPTDSYPFLVCQMGVAMQDFLGIVVGTGATSLVNGDGWFGEWNLSTGASATGEAAAKVCNADHILFDANSNRLVWEAVFHIPTLSTAGVQEFRSYYGYRSIDGNDGAFFRTTTGSGIEAVTRSGGTETATDSGLTLVADTTYWMRIVVVNNANVYFWIDALGNELEDTTIGPHTTNIPSADMACGAHIVKTVGTTARTIRMQGMLAYQRRSTSLAGGG